MSIRTSEIIGKAILETLENRQMMSAVTLSDGVLVVQGNAHSQNQISIHQSNKKIWAVTDKGASHKIAVSSVRQIRITGGDQDDTIAVQAAVRIPVYVDGQAGNDSIRTARGNDTVVGGSGNDSIVTGAGKDVIDGGDGNDTILAGSGQDKINGSGGDDVIDDGKGNDIVNGGGGNDTVHSGAGRDRIHLGAGHNHATGISLRDVVTRDTGDVVSSLSVSVGDDNSAPTPTNPTNNGGGQTVNPIPVTNPTTNPTPAPTPVPTDGTDSPQGAITLLENSSVVDHAVHVNGLTSNLKAGTVLTAKFQWDFGDTGSNYNQLVGWNAAHLYTRPGQYTIKLTITNEDGKTSVTSKTINIAASNRKVIYVSNDGSDSASGLSPQSAVKSFAKAMGMIGDNTEVLFNSGDTFNLSAGATINHTNVVVGSYGNGNKPVFNYTGAKNYTAMIRTGTKAKDVTIENVTFDSIYSHDEEKTGMPDAVNAGGTNITVYQVTFLNIGYGLNTNTKPTGVLMQECDAPDVTGIRSYLAYCQGSDQVYVGNTVANSTREHCIRVDGTDRILIADNNFTNLDRRSLGDNLDTSKQTITVHWGSYAYVYGNTTHDGRVEIGPLGEADGLKPENINRRLNWVRIEDNDFTFSAENRLEIDHGTTHVMITDNKISVVNGAGIAIQAEGMYTDWTAYGTRHVEDATVAGDNDIIGATKKVSVGKGSVGIVLLPSGSPVYSVGYKVAA